jgi:hypothetical protein
VDALDDGGGPGGVGVDGDRRPGISQARSIGLGGRPLRRAPDNDRRPALRNPKPLSALVAGAGGVRPRKTLALRGFWSPERGRTKGKGERNFHLFVEMSRLTLGVKTLSSRKVFGESAATACAAGGDE